MAVVGTERVVDAHQVTRSCRSRLRQVLSAIEAEDVPRDAAFSTVEASRCAAGHDLVWADLTGRYVTVRDEILRVTREGRDWLLDHGAPSPDWHAVAGATPALREWQAEALKAWSEHSRQGVVEAVTGTGKSRVGVEAAREALADGFSVLIVVPGTELIQQWAHALRRSGITNVGQRGDGGTATFATHQVVVGTIQSLWSEPTGPADGRVLLIADECHRYGSEQWRKVLHPSYRRRLGLTATFERSDDGLEVLQQYFGGPPVYRIDFDRAIADGVVAAYDVALIPTDLSPSERWAYDRVEKALQDARAKLLAADFPAEPFGLFLREVQRAAEEFPDPTVEDAARAYLKAFSERIDIVTATSAKLAAIPALAPLVAGSRGSILFTRRTEAAEDIADSLSDEGIAAVAVHSKMRRPERTANLDGLKSGRIKALAAPMVLDEGIDVPNVDLGAVLAGSRSRRQMIQRMGRVLRLKSGGRKAKFLVFYARETIEDPKLMSDPAEGGCLDVILGSADSVHECTSDDLRSELLAWSQRLGDETDATHTSTTDRMDDRPLASEPQSEPPSASPTEPPGFPPHPDSVRVAASAVRSFRNYHGGSPLDAEIALVELLLHLANDHSSHRTRGETDIYWSDRVQLAVANGEIVQYFHEPVDNPTAPSRVQALGSATKNAPAMRSGESARTERAARADGEVPTLADQLARVDPVTLPMTQKVLDAYIGSHGGTSEQAEEHLREMLTDFLESGRKRVGRKGHVQLARSGFFLTVDPYRFVFYRTSRKDHFSWQEVRSQCEPADATPDAQEVLAQPHKNADSEEAGPPTPPPAVSPEADNMHPGDPSSDVVDVVASLVKLADLHGRGLLTTAEFTVLKARLIEP